MLYDSPTSGSFQHETVPEPVATPTPDKEKAPQGNATVACGALDAITDVYPKERKGKGK